MEKDDLPSYSAPEEVTLFHSDFVGNAVGEECQVLIPPSTNLIRTYHSSHMIHGLEVFSTGSGPRHVLGDCCTSHVDFSFTEPLKSVKIWYHDEGIAALQYFTGRHASAIIGHHRSTLLHHHSAVLEGIVVGFIAQRVPTGLGKFGVITASEYGDYSAFQKSYDQHREQGMLMDEKIDSMKDEKKAEQSRKRDMGRFKFDTGRITGNRGVGIRWNHESKRVEIYQGSNDPYRY